MSSIASQEAPQQFQLGTLRPRFFGIVSGELYKIRRMRFIWICFFLLLGALCLPNIVFTALANISSNNDLQKQISLFTFVQVNLGVLRVFIGFFLIILTASVYGREYQQGTIRILLARGVGRLQLLFAKLLAIIVIAVVVLVMCLIVQTIWLGVFVNVKLGGFDILNKITDDFRTYTWLYFLSVLVSMGSTILMALAITTIGRSLAFGMSAGLAWFPADNILPGILLLVTLLTNNVFWVNITQYFLGPNLNYLPATLISNSLLGIIGTIGTAPQNFAELRKPVSPPVDSTHALLVIAGYSAIFLIVSIYLTWKRDIKD